MNLKTYMGLLLISLTTFASDRTVSRQLKMADQLDHSVGGELETGRYTLMSKTVLDIDNIPGNAVHGGTWNIVILGQIKLAESATSDQVEDAEFEMFQQIGDWLNSPLADEISCIEIKEMAQSKQLETPYGWIAVQLEVTL